MKLVCGFQRVVFMFYVVDGILQYKSSLFMDMCLVWKWL